MTATRAELLAQAEALIDEYITEYEFDGDAGVHTPTVDERMLLHDCVNGLLAEPKVLDALAAWLALRVGQCAAGEPELVAWPVLETGKTYHVVAGVAPFTVCGTGIQSAPPADRARELLAAAHGYIHYARRSQGSDAPKIEHDIAAFLKETP